MTKIISFLLCIGSIVFSTICGVYAYNNEMWYELFCTIGGCVLMVYCSYLFANSSKYMKEEENEEDYF